MPGLISDAAATQYPLVVERFAQQQVAASQAAVALNAIATRAASGTLNVIGMVTPFSGSIVGLAAALSAAASAGQATLDVTINGVVTGFQVILTTGAAGSKTQDFGVNRFNAGDTIGIKITTNAAWNGTASDLLAEVYLILEGWQP